VCRVRPFTADELATLLARNRKYMQDRVLAPLRSQGALMLTIPNQPHHPDQAYSTPPGTGKDRFVRP
jgi:ATP-dependent DNA helicase RecG